MTIGSTPAARQAGQLAAIKAGWTEERVEALRKLFAEGYSSSQIAKQIGATRNAVIGKISRLGLAGRPTPSAPRRTYPKSMAGLPNAPKAHVKPPPARTFAIGGKGAIIENGEPRPAKTFAKAGAFAPLKGTEPVALLDLCWNHCRWPIDCDDGETRYCGAKKADNRYCVDHQRMSMPATAARTEAQKAADLSRAHKALERGRAARRFA